MQEGSNDTEVLRIAQVLGGGSTPSPRTDQQCGKSSILPSQTSDPLIRISVINYRRSPTRYWRSAVPTDT